MQLEVVNIDDVYPNENNPRKKFEDIPQLAASFDLNQERQENRSYRLSWYATVVSTTSWTVSVATVP